jgi:hypothetical protein
MVAIGNTNGYNNIFSRFIYSMNSTFSNKMNATNTNYNLNIVAINIKNNDTLLALFLDGSRIILGQVDMAKYSFSFK